VKYQEIRKKGVGYIVKLRNQGEEDKILQLDGSTSGSFNFRITRTDIHLSARAIFDLVAKDLRIKEEANSRRKTPIENTRRIQATGMGSSDEEIEETEIDRGRKSWSHKHHTRTHT
jgi:hypothetical protein